MYTAETFVYISQAVCIHRQFVYTGLADCVQKPIHSVNVLVCLQKLNDFHMLLPAHSSNSCSIDQTTQKEDKTQVQLFMVPISDSAIPLVGNCKGNYFPCTGKIPFSA